MLIAHSSPIFTLSSVYKTLGYIEVVAKGAEVSVRAAVDEVQSKPSYATDGEPHSLFLHFALCTDDSSWYTLQWMITDACHDSTANASTPLCLVCLEGKYVFITAALRFTLAHYSTQKIVGLSTISRVGHCATDKGACVHKGRPLSVIARGMIITPNVCCQRVQ